MSPRVGVVAASRSRGTSVAYRHRMDQQVRFSSAGGWRIAYAGVGEGPSLPLPAWWVSHVELTWRNRHGMVMRSRAASA
jgi:hypothetical protein